LPPAPALPVIPADAGETERHEARLRALDKARAASACGGAWRAAPERAAEFHQDSKRLKELQGKFDGFSPACHIA